MKTLLVFGRRAVSTPLSQHQQGFRIQDHHVFNVHPLSIGTVRGFLVSRWFAKDDSLRTAVTTSNHPTGLIITVIVGRAFVDTSELLSCNHSTDVCTPVYVLGDRKGLQFVALSCPLVSSTP